MAKKALLVGCNYPGQGKSELNGCVNDVIRMRGILTSRFGFDDADILDLVDTDESGEQPTGANIRLHLDNRIRELEDGDTLVFFFSGHGTQLPYDSDTGYEVDNTGYEEAIVPTDQNYLTDDDFRDFVEKVPAGATFTFISDSCFSGGLIDSAEDQTGDHHVVEETQAEETDGFQQANSATQGGKTVRRISAETLADLLSQRTPYRVEVGNIRTAVYDLFRDEASLSVRRFEHLVWTQLSQEAGGSEVTVSSLSIAFLRERLADQDQDEYLRPSETVGEYHVRRRVAAEAADMGILLSGCQADELSQESQDSEGEVCGAFTKAIETVLSRSNRPLTNRELIAEVRAVIESEFVPTEEAPEPQHPCLFCSDENAEQVFICDV